MTMTREQVAALLDGSLADTKLAYSDSGYGVIYIAPVENEDTAVAVPVRDKNMGWHKANPEVYMALVDRFNSAPDLARQLLAAMDRLADADMAQAALVQELRQFVIDSYQCGCMDAGCAGRHAERNSTLEALSETLDALAPDAGVKDLSALRAERDRIDQWRETAIVERDTYSEERDDALRQLADAQADRDRLAAKLAEAEAQVAALRGLAVVRAEREALFRRARPAALTPAEQQLFDQSMREAAGKIAKEQME